MPTCATSRAPRGTPKVDGIIVSNTTVARPEASPRIRAGAEAGGLSRKTTDGRVHGDAAKVYARRGEDPAGGVRGSERRSKDAYRKIRAGASLVQLYTAFAYQGPAMLPRMKESCSSAFARTGSRPCGMPSARTIEGAAMKGRGAVVKDRVYTAKIVQELYYYVSYGMSNRSER